MLAMSNISLSMSLEDYLESIIMIKEERGIIRVKDVASKMKVATPSVVSAIKKLQQKGLVVHEHYGYIKLTTKGEKMGKEIYRKHKILTFFLHKILKLPKETAEQDACAMEHYITKEGLNKIIDFIKNFKKKEE